jgi:hypothetical protein
MKKILFLALVIAFSFASQAQRASLMPLAVGDTMITSASLDTVIKTIPITAGYSALGIQVVGTKVSGTVSGKAYLYGSLDGTNYTVTDSSSAFVDQTTNAAFFTKVTVPFTYYRVQYRSATGATSTQSVIIRIYYVARRHD